MSVTQQALDICMDIIKNSVTHDLPYANTEASKNFTSICGSHATNSNYKYKSKRVAGCYHLHEDGKIFGTGYIGQSIVLGQRVRNHSNGKNLTTKDYIKSIQSRGKVTLYLLPSNLSQVTSVTEKEFLNILWGAPNIYSL